MSGEVKFDGKVAVAEGAEGGVGRQYGIGRQNALELARRSARVVVNELE